MGSNVEVDIAEIKQAQHYARHHIALAQYAAPDDQISEDQDAGEREGRQQAAGKYCAALGQLFEKNVYGAVAQPDGQQIEHGSGGITRSVLLRSEEHTSELQSLMSI